MYYVVTKHNCFTSTKIPFETLEEAKDFIKDVSDSDTDKSRIFDESGKVVYP